MLWKTDVQKKYRQQMQTKMTKETLTSTSCGIDKQQRRRGGEKEREMVKRDQIQHFTVFIILASLRNTYGSSKTVGP